MYDNNNIHPVPVSTTPVRTYVVPVPAGAVRTPAIGYPPWNFQFSEFPVMSTLTD